MAHKFQQELAQLAPEIGQVRNEATIRVHLNAKGEKEEKKAKQKWNSISHVQRTK